MQMDLKCDNKLCKWTKVLYTVICISYANGLKVLYTVICISYANGLKALYTV